MTSLSKPEIARKHYLQVTDEHFGRAAAGPGRSATVTTVTKTQETVTEANDLDTKALRSPRDGRDGCDGLFRTLEKGGPIIPLLAVEPCGDDLVGVGAVEAHQNAHHQAHQNALPHSAAQGRKVTQSIPEEPRKPPVVAALCGRLPNAAGRCVNTGPCSLPPRGGELSANSLGNSGVAESGGAESGAVLLRLRPHWYLDPISKSFRHALQECIRAHGPITLDDTRVNSAVKRLYGVLKGQREVR